MTMTDAATYDDDGDDDDDDNRHLGTLRVVAAASVALLISGGCPFLATAAVPSPLDPTSEVRHGATSRRALFAA